jgi:hypothetical protein
MLERSEGERTLTFSPQDDPARNDRPVPHRQRVLALDWTLVELRQHVQDVLSQRRELGDVLDVVVRRGAELVEQLDGLEVSHGAVSIVTLSSILLGCLRYGPRGRRRLERVGVVVVRDAAGVPLFRVGLPQLGGRSDASYAFGHGLAAQQSADGGLGARSEEGEGELNQLIGEPWLGRHGMLDVYDACYCGGVGVGSRRGRGRNQGAAAFVATKAPLYEPSRLLSRDLHEDDVRTFEMLYELPRLQVLLLLLGLLSRLELLGPSRLPPLDSPGNERLGLVVREEVLEYNLREPSSSVV